MVIPSETSRRTALAVLIVASSPLGAQPYYGRPYQGAPGQPYYAPPYYGQPYYGQPPQPAQTQPWPVQPSPPQSAQPPMSSQPGASQYRPIPPSHAQGVPPRYQPPSPAPIQGTMPAQPPQGYPGYAPNWQPGYAPGYSSGYAPSAVQPTAVRAPTLEWSLEFADPYLQQPTILKLDVVSHIPFLDAPNLELPPSSDVLMRKLQDPINAANQRRLDNATTQSFRISIIPLSTGDLELPPIKVTGTLTGTGMGFGQRYEAGTERPIHLQVRPPMTSVRPWLPLKSLTLKSSLDREGTLEPGQPVTLALEIEAVGGTAVQLPSLESQLTGTDLRVYREQTFTTTELSPDGRQLLANRTEYYTLVPQTGGRITLPEMSLAWWNVDLGVREVARLPLKTLDVRGGGPFGFSAATLAASPWARLWIPITGVLLLIGGYWAGVFYRGRVPALGRDLLRLTGRGLSTGYRRTATRIGPRLRPLAPAALIERGRTALWRVLPAGRHVIGRVRHANRADRPEDWYPRFASAPHGGGVLRGESNQPAVIAHIRAHRPGVDPAELARLLSRLDAAIYGGAPLDFPRWKREFMRQVRRGFSTGERRDGASGRIRWAGLPALNPRSA
ncbi:MAG: hypothetical protein MZV65_04625 [Chromatiales bacterium]|nr:hypothetical protein [Chromatiales bacterium]